MCFHRQFRIAAITLYEFALGPRSPFLGPGGGGMLLLGLAFEASRLMKILLRQLSRVPLF